MKPFWRKLVIFSGILSAAIFVGPFLVPVPPLERTFSEDELADEDSKFERVNGIRVHFKVSGDWSTSQKVKNALVLLHGFGASLFSWREVLVSLGNERPVIAFDRPAFGLTERPIAWEGKNPYSPESQVDLTIALMDRMGIERAVLVGNSAGGTIAALTAMRYPQRVRALVLVDAAIYLETGAPAWVRPLLKTPQMRHLSPLIVRQIQKRSDNLLRMSWHDPSKINNATYHGYKKPFRTHHWDQALWELTLASGSPGLDQQLKTLQMPVLVISGDDDRVVPTQQSVRLAEEIPNAELAIIPDCGHLPQEERPQKFLETIENFLQRIP